MAFLAGGMVVGSTAFAVPVHAPTPQAVSHIHQAHRLTSSQRREVLKKLNLTPDQKESMRERRTAYRKKMAELNAQLEIKHIDLDSEMEKPHPDKDKLQKLSEDIGKIQSQKIYEETDARVDFEKILTPEQLETWKSFKQDRKASESEGDLEMEVGAGSATAH
jgi:Spy/CpxP family protein refolding chaperone